VRRLGTFAAGVALCATLFVGCSTARTDVGTTDESCYLALPTATKAVGHHGHLEGIRKFTLTNLHSFAPKLYRRVAGRVPAHQAVCVAAFTGHFNADSVSKPLGRQEGILAVSVVTSPGNELLGTLILRRIPVRFSHTHMF
jgi:hypothetical protein